MKKVFKLIMPLLTTFILVGCGDNYQPASAEQKAAISERLSTMSIAEEEDADIVGVKVTGELLRRQKNNSNGRTAVYFSHKSDESSSDQPKTYTSLRVEVSAIISSHATVEAYSVTSEDNTAFYISYETKLLDYVSNGKIVTDSSFLSTSFLYGSYLKIISEQKTDYNLADIVQLLKNSGAEVYADGENKIKISFTTENISYNFYVYLNDDSPDYSIRMESQYEDDYYTYDFNINVEPSKEAIALPDTSEYIDNRIN